ncbi:MAG: formylglycine-generating enzyme family protein [Phaeodactylibacter sp.]|nr:formylglycine-generating enzyme family protein [Phaeodactylibacter sp.]
MNETARSETVQLRLRQFENQVTLLMDSFELYAKAYYARKETKPEPYGWADYFNEQAQVSLSDHASCLSRLEQAQTVRIRLKKPALLIQPVLDTLPEPEKIRRLDLSHNALKGTLDLSRFTQLRVVALAGNPALSLPECAFPSGLKHILLSREEIAQLAKTGFKQSFPDIIASQNGTPEFSLGSAPFQEPELVEVKGGTFWMGSGEGTPNEDEKPRHLVQLSSYWIGKYPVTVEAYARFVYETGYVTEVEKEGWSVAAFWRGDSLDYYCKIGCNWRQDAYGRPMDNSFARHPVIHVSWQDAAAYCRWLSWKTGRYYNLPTEAQWEYAAIGGHKAGMKDKEGHALPAFPYAGSDRLEEVGWFLGKFGGNPPQDYRTKPVGALQPNELGLYDMSGHVWEWCADWYDEQCYQKRLEKGAVKNPAGPECGDYRVLRGGGWYRSARNCRVANRSSYDPGYRNFNTGFRLACPPYEGI